jgi:trimeric autotransporter adhesin
LCADLYPSDEEEDAMAWRAILTAEVPLQPSRQEKRRYQSRGIALALLVAVLAIIFSRRGPVVSLPAIISFAPQAVQSPGREQLVVLTNEGSSPLNIQSALIAGDQANDFKLTDSNCSNAPILPNQSCNLGIAFMPRAGGERNAVLSLIDNANDSPQRVLVKGIGILRADLTIAPIALDFGTQNIDVLIEQEVTLANVGSASVTVDEITLAGEGTGFSIAENHCIHIAIPAGGSCVVKVQFRPETTGSQSALLTVRDSSGDTPHEVPLSGSGTLSPSAGAQVQPATLDFGSQSLENSSSREVLVTSSGTSPLTIASISIMGEGSTEFGADNGCSQRVLEPKQQCTLQLRFAPRAQGAHSAELLIFDNASNSPQRVTLTGSGYVAAVAKPPTPTFTPAPISQMARILVHPENFDFREQEVFTKSAPLPIVLTSVGKAPSEIQGITLQGKSSKDFKVQNPCTGRRLTEAESCQITVTFAPTAPWIFPKYPSPRSAELVLTTTGGSSKVELNGTATRAPIRVEPTFQVNPAQLDFGRTSVRSQSDVQTVTLSNPGESPIQLSTIAILDNAFTGLFTGRDSGHFRVTKVDCPNRTIPPQGICSIAVTFTPQTAGNLHAYLTLQSSVPQIQSVRLTGIGLSARNDGTPMRNDGTPIQ